MSTFDYSPIISGAVVVALDKYLLKEASMERSLYLGAATVAGIYAGQIVAPMVPFILLYLQQLCIIIKPLN